MFIPSQKNTKILSISITDKTVFFFSTNMNVMHDENENRLTLLFIYRFIFNHLGTFLFAVAVAAAVSEAGRLGR